MNDSLSAFVANFESIDVFFSWKGQDNLIRVLDKENDFDNLWGNTTTKVKVIDFPKVVKEKLQTYKQGYVNLGIDVEQFKQIEIIEYVKAKVDLMMNLRGLKIFILKCQMKLTYMIIKKSQ